MADTSMPRNLVVCSDGTGQEGGIGPNTNVFKLFNMVRDLSPDQIAFYDAGVGTGWRRITGKVAGMGLSRNVLEAYRFLFDNYRDGDRLFLFGFSRGAATVRSLSGFIHLFGILPRSRPDLIDRAYKTYTIRDPAQRKERAGDMIRSISPSRCRIHCLGVWDTVAALGLPYKKLDDWLDTIPLFKHKFHDLRLSECVANAYHALAIDEERLVFQPEIWDPDIDPDTQQLEQVWFPGMHSDVGGGYEEQQLSDIALEWMIGKAVDLGLRLRPDPGVRVAPDPNGPMHDSRTGWKKVFSRAARFWPRATHGLPVVHRSVLDRKLNRTNRPDPPYRPWILGGDTRVAS